MLVGGIKVELVKSPSHLNLLQKYLELMKHHANQTAYVPR